MLVFSTETYRPLRDALCRSSGYQAGEVETSCFPDGERYQRITTPVREVDAVLLAGTTSDEQTLALYDLASGLVANRARSLNLMIPYFGYSTMDRASAPGEVVSAKTRAALLSSIPRAACGNRVLILDPHSEGIPYYFDAAMPAGEIDASPIAARVARRLGGTDFVLASPDAGRAKWVQSLARGLGISAAFAFKRRFGSERTEVVALLADVRGRRVVICDDMIRTGVTLLSAGRAFRDAGASAIAIYATHGVFPGDSLARLESSGLFERIVTTDSHPRATEVRSPILAIEPVADLLAEALRGGAPGREGAH